MSTNQFDVGPGGQPAPKKGMSTGAKVAIILAIVFGILALICCGGIFWMVKDLQGAMSTDPVKVTEVTKEITDIDIPAGFEPQVSMDVKIPVVGRLMTFTVHEDDQGSGALVLVSMGEALAQQDEAQAQQQLNQQLQQQNMESEDMIVESEVVKQVEIRGEQATFTIAKGSGTDTGAARIRVVGAFKGKSGPAMLMLNVDAERMDEQQANEMIESIR